LIVPANTGAAGRHLAVHRHAFAGPHAHDGAQRHRGHRHRRPPAIGLLYGSLLGGQGQQALDRIAGAIDRACLDRLGDGVQRHHHGRLGPLPDDEGASDGHGHQGVDIQAPLAQRRQPLLVDIEAGQPDGGGRHREPRGLPGLRVRGEEADQLRADGQRQSARKPPGSARPGAVLVVLRPGACAAGRRGARFRHRLRIEAGLADRHEGLLDRRWRGVDGHRARPELKRHRADVGDMGDRATDLRLFAGAVHRRDAEPCPAGIGRGIWWRRLGAGLPAAGAAGLGGCDRRSGDSWGLRGFQKGLSSRYRH
jgi:hypothetical protein